MYTNTIKEIEDLLKERDELFGAEKDNYQLELQYNLCKMRDGLKHQLAILKYSNGAEMQLNDLLTNKRFKSVDDIKQTIKPIFNFDFELVEASKDDDDLSDNELISDLRFMGIETAELSIYYVKTRIGEYLITGVYLN